MGDSVRERILWKNRIEDLFLDPGASLSEALSKSHLKIGSGATENGDSHELSSNESLSQSISPRRALDTLSLQNDAAPEFPAPDVVVTILPLESTLEATFSGDTGFEIDWYQFTVDGAQGARIRLTYVDIEDGGDEFYLPQMPEISVYDSQGNILHSSDGGFNLDLISDFEFVLDISAASAGTYYIEVGSWEVGTYSLGFETEISNFIAGSAVLGIGEALTSDLHSTQDIDVFEIDVAAGEIFVFQLESPNADFRLSDADGNTIELSSDIYSVNVDYPTTQALVLTGDQSGRFFVNVSTNFGAVDYTVSAYSLQDEAGATTTSARDIAFGTTFNGSLYTELDVDWFKFEAVAGEYYIFTSTNHPFSYSFADSFRILDATGNALDASSYSINSSNGFDRVDIVFTTDVEGEYFLQIGGFVTDGKIDIGYSYSANTYVDAPADTTSSSSLWRNGTEISGLIIDGGDSDWHSLSIDAPQTLTFELLFNGSRAQGSELEVYDEDGNVIALLSDQTNADQLLQYHFSDSGTYYIGVSGGGTLSNYTLSATVASEGTPIPISTDALILEQPSNLFDGTQRFDFGTLELSNGDLLSFVVQGTMLCKG